MPSKHRPNATKRVLAIGDLHCGSCVGITPPAWQWDWTDRSTTKRNKYGRIQRELWEAYGRILVSLAPIDVLLVAGDMIDGKGKRSGGTEQITTSLQDQVDMAVEVINYVKLRGARKTGKLPIVACYGTTYHVAEDGDDAENIVARDCGFTSIGSHEWPSVNGHVFDLKHKIGSSSIPHGRHTAVARDMLWNELWSDSERGLQPRAKTLIRGHVHYHQFCGNGHRLGMTLPALQAMGTKYGSRECSGLVDWGVVHFDIDKAGTLVDWRAHLVNLKTQVAKVTEV